MLIIFTRLKCFFTSQELDPGCGIEDFNKVLADYSFVTSLYTTYGKELSSGAYSSHHPDDRPEVTC